MLKQESHINSLDKSSKIEKISRAETLEQQFNLTFIETARKTGLFMVVIGGLGILVPNFIGLSFNAFVGGIFLLASLALTYNAWHNKRQNMSLWFKPIILVILAFIILLHPAIILSVLGLLIAIYFLISGFSSIMLAFELNSSVRWFSLLSGVLSFILGVIVIDSWPFASAWIIGLIIGINFLFDGIALLGIANKMKKSQAL